MRELEKHKPNIFASFNPYRPNQQLYCTGGIIYYKLNSCFFVSADRQTFLGFEMTANLRDTSSLNAPIEKDRLCTQSK